MLVSVVVNSRNGERFVPACLNSVLAQRFSSYEIIFYDNFSLDNTKTVVTQQYPSVKYFRSERKLSLGAARNLAIEKCSGNLVAFLDVDDVWSPEKLTKTIPLFNDPEISLVYSDALFVGVDTFLQSERKDLVEGSCLRELIKGYSIPFSTALFRRNAISPDKKCFDERLNLALDQQLFIRIAAKSKVGVVREPLATILLHSESTSNKNVLEFLAEQRIVYHELADEIPNFKRNFENETKYARRRLELDVIFKLFVGSQTFKVSDIGEQKLLLLNRVLFYCALVLPRNFRRNALVKSRKFFLRFR